MEIKKKNNNRTFDLFVKMEYPIISSCQIKRKGCTLNKCNYLYAKQLDYDKKIIKKMTMRKLKFV